MCGIAGYIGNKKVDEGNIRHTLRLMKNRGPDHSDYIKDNCGANQILFLHSRLSIIDLDKRANQPFTINGVSLIFNGEIYNYKELRSELENKSIKFFTESDTEVLLQSYLYYGEECVNHFKGMWSFAIFDNLKNKMFLSRDRFAEKPLYYMETADGIYFGSEIKFIKALSDKNLTVNYDHLIRYLINGYKSLYKKKETFFIEIKELSNASNFIISKELKKTIYKYWKPRFAPVDMTIEEAVKGTRNRLLESMKIRLRSDVPLAFCLSGGVDSSVLASIAAKEFKYNVAAFSIIDSDERYNEYDNIKATVDDLKCESTTIELSYEDTFNKLRDLIIYHDSPIATISYLIHSYLSEAISSNGYKVAFSGTGADELFTGYYDHFNLYLYEMKDSKCFSKYLSEWKEYIAPTVRNPYLKNPKLYFENSEFREHIYLKNTEFSNFLTKKFHESFYEEEYCSSILRNRMLNELFHESIPVILHEDDLNSMFYSVENRSPYLDRELFEFSCSIPSEYLIQNGFAKFVLRESMKGILNDKVRLDRQKKGFNASINSIIDFSDNNKRKLILDDSSIYKIIKREKIEKLFDLTPMPNSYSKFLFSFINAKIFLELNN